MALNENVKKLIRSVVGNDLSKAKSYVKVILENENAASNKSFCDYMKKELETQPNFIELPYDIKGILKMEDVNTSFNENRYFITDREKRIFKQIDMTNNTNKKLKQLGIRYLNTTLLYGETGTGKTTFGKYVAYKLGLPFAYLNFSQCITSLLGGTSKNIDKVFEYVSKQKCVLMLDEIDAIGIKRGKEDLGEMSRIGVVRLRIIKHGSKYPEDKNSNFSLEAKFESMIKIAKKIINQNKNNTGDCSIETALAYDVANYLPKVLKENEELKADNYELKKETTKYKNMYESEHRIQLLRNEQLDRKQNAITKCNELQKENEKLKEYIAIAPNLDEMTAVKYRNIQQDGYIQGRVEEQQKAKQIIYENYIPKSKLKDIIDRIDYDIKKTKEIISKNTNIYASYRKNDYQIVRLRAMNTKSLDIKNRLQELLKEKGE